MKTLTKAEFIALTAKQDFEAHSFHREDAIEEMLNTLEKAFGRMAKKINFELPKSFAKKVRSNGFKEIAADCMELCYYSEEYRDENNVIDTEEAWNEYEKAINEFKDNNRYFAADVANENMDLILDLLRNKMELPTPK